MSKWYEIKNYNSRQYFWLLYLETEKKTNEMMIENGDDVCMSNCGFSQHNQTPTATTDTPELCTSGCRIDMPVTWEYLQNYLIDKRLV